jgi:hypothetical protein
MLALPLVLGNVLCSVEICTSGTVAGVTRVLLGTFGRALLAQIRRIARHESAPSFAARGCILGVMLAPITIFGGATCGTTLAAENTAADAEVAPKSSSPDPQALLQAYERTLLPYQQFKVKWTERNAAVREDNKPEWLNSLEETLVRDRDRQKYRAIWTNYKDTGESERNWEEDVLEKGKTGVSVHPARSGEDPQVPIVISDLRVSDEDYFGSMRRGIPAGIIGGIWIPTFLQSSKLSAQQDTLDGRPVDVLRGVSGDIEITLWLDPAMNHIPRKIVYDNHNSTPGSPPATLVYKVNRFEEKGGVFIPVEAIETQHTAAHVAAGMKRLKVVNGKVVLDVLPKKDENGKIAMDPASTGLTEVRLVDIQFNPKFADNDFKFSKPIPDGTKVSVSFERPIRHVSYEWRQGKVVKVVEPAIMGKFRPTTDVRAEIADRLKAAKWGKDRVLVVFGANTWRRCAVLEKTFLSNPETLLLLVDDVGAYAYRVVFADLTNPTNRALATEYGLTLDGRQSPCAVVLDANGRVLCSQDLAVFQRDDSYDAEKLDAFLKKWEAPSENAEDVLLAGLARAAKEQMKPFVVITGAHCVPCHRLIRFLGRWQDVLGQDYVLVKIDADRMTHVAEAKTRIGYETDRLIGIPWYVILSPAGEKLITSMGPLGNVGFPSKQPGIDHLMTMIRQTAAHISPEQLKAIEESLVTADLEK